MRRRFHRVFALSILAAACSIQAAAATGSTPKLGRYVGRSTDNAKGNLTLEVARITSSPFVLTVAHARCAPAGGGVAKEGSCVTLAPGNLIQATCSTTGLVNDAFFPAVGAMSLTATGSLTHVFPLYDVGGEASVSGRAGAAKVGTFQLTLSVNGAGAATGTARYTANFNDGNGICDSGVVKIAATVTT
jgi:hypothetical protein